MFAAKSPCNIPVIELTDNGKYVYVKRARSANSSSMNGRDCVSLPGCDPICAATKSAMAGQTITVCHCTELSPITECLVVICACRRNSFPGGRFPRSASRSLLDNVARRKGRAMFNEYVHPISNRISRRIPL